ncbi:hypothetical protein GCM10022397_18160 [Flavivirga jejuensis]
MCSLKPKNTKNNKYFSYGKPYCYMKIILVYLNRLNFPIFDLITIRLYAVDENL